MEEIKSEPVKRGMIEDDPTVPPEWPRFKNGELLDLKGYWFEVVRLDPNGGMRLLPKGPTKALTKRLARGAVHRSKQVRKERNRRRARA